MHRVDVEVAGEPAGDRRGDARGASGDASSSCVADDRGRAAPPRRRGGRVEGPSGEVVVVMGSSLLACAPGHHRGQP